MKYNAIGFSVLIITQVCIVHSVHSLMLLLVVIFQDPGYRGETAGFASPLCRGNYSWWYRKGNRAWYNSLCSNFWCSFHLYFVINALDSLSWNLCWICICFALLTSWIFQMKLQVLGGKRWKEVTTVFSFPSSATNASFILRKYYISLIYHYERVYYFKAKHWTPSPGLCKLLH